MYVNAYLLHFIQKAIQVLPEISVKKYDLVANEFYIR